MVARPQSEAALTPRRASFAFVLIALSLVATHALWFDADARIPFWDQYRYFEMSRTALEHFEAEDWPHSLDLHASHPPLYPLLGGVWMQALGRVDFETARTLNLALVLLGLVSVYALARHWFERGPALYVATVAQLFPLPYSFAHLYYLENLITPVVALSLATLMRKDSLDGGRWTLLLGILLGIGCLVKWTTPIFLVTPVAWLLWRRRAGRGLVVLTVIGLAVAGPWYWSHRDGIQTFLAGGVTGGEGWLSAQLGVQGLLYYPRELVGSGLGLPAAIAAAVGALGLLLRRVPGRGFVFLALLVPLVLFTMIMTKKARHLLPLFPLCALLVGWGCAALPRPRLARAAAALIALHLIACCLHASFGIPDRRARIEIAGIKLPLLSSSRVPGPPDSRVWPYDAILQSIETAHPGLPRPEGVILCNLNGFREVGFRYQAWQHRRRAFVALVAHHYRDDLDAGAEFPLGPHFDPKLDETTRGLLKADFLISKSGMNWVRYQSTAAGGFHLYGARISEALWDPDGPLQPWFRLASEHALPDGTTARVHVPMAHGAERDRALAHFTLRFEPQHELAWQTLGEPRPQKSEELERRLIELEVWTPEEAAARRQLRSGLGAEAVAALWNSYRSGPPREPLLRLILSAGPDAEAEWLLAHWKAYRTAEDSGRHALALARWSRDQGLVGHARRWARRALEAQNLSAELAALFQAMERLPGQPQASADRAEWLAWLRAADRF